MRRIKAPARPASDDADTGPLKLGEFWPYRFSVVTELMSGALAERYEKKFGLSIPEWRVMAVLQDGPPQTTQEVIRKTAMDRVRVSRAAIRLEDKGFLLRVANPSDQRAHLLRLSPSGLKTYRQIVPVARRLQTFLQDGLTAGEMDALERVLTKLHARSSQLESGDWES